MLCIHVKCEEKKNYSPGEYWARWLIRSQKSVFMHLCFSVFMHVCTWVHKCLYVRVLGLYKNGRLWLWSVQMLIYIMPDLPTDPLNQLSRQYPNCHFNEVACICSSVIQTHTLVCHAHNDQLVQPDIWIPAHPLPCFVRVMELHTCC